MYGTGLYNKMHILLCLDSSLKVSQVVKGEMSAKTTYQRSAKGPVSVNECAADGSYVSLENSGRKVRSLINKNHINSNS